LLRVSVVAARLNVSRTTVRRWCDEGRLVFYQPAGAGGLLLIDENSIDELLCRWAAGDPVGPSENF